MAKQAPTQRIGVPHVGRDEELAAVLGELRSFGSVLIAGDAGVGKTRLAGEAIRRLRRGVVPRVRATHASATIPYGALAHLLPHPPAGVAPGSLGWVESAIAPSDGPQLPLLFVDDAQHLDPASAVVVHHLALTGRVQLLLTVRVGETPPDPVMALWKDDLVTRVDLGAFDVDDTALLAAALLGDPVEPVTVRSLHDLSGGNAMLLRELVEAARAADALDGPPWRLCKPIPITAARLLDVIDDRVGRLDARQTLVLELLALAEPLTLEHLGVICGDAAVEECEARRLIVVGTTVDRAEARLAHPLIGEAIRHRCGRARTRSHYRRLARTAASPREHRDVLALATWQLEGGRVVESETLLGAARTAWVAHQHQLTERFAEAALRLDGRADAGLLLASVYNHRQQPELALQALDAIGAAPDGERQGTELAKARALALSLQPGRVPEALAVLERARSGIRSTECRQELDLLALLMRSRTIAATESYEAFGRLLEAEPASPALRAEILSSRAGIGVAQGRYTTAVRCAQQALAEIEQWRDQIPVLVLPLHMNWGWAATYGGNLCEADRALAALDATVQSASWLDLDSSAALLRSQMLLMRGDLAGALHAAETPCDGRQFAAGRHGMAAYARALLGDASGARTALDAAWRRPMMRFGVADRSFVELAESWVTAAAGDIDEAVRQALSSADEYAAREISSMVLLRCYDVVRLGQASRVVDRIKAVATAAEGDLPRLIARHAEAAATADAAELESVAAAFGERGYLPFAADAFAHAAKAYQGKAAAAAAARRARQMAAQCPGLTTPALSDLALPALTRRERQIARLAASGLTSQEIADQLVASKRTVENHLHHVYSKLRVDGRRGLRNLLD